MMKCITFFFSCIWSVIFGILYFILCPYIDEENIVVAMQADYLNHFEHWL